MKTEDRLVHHHYSGEPCKACRLAGIKEVVDWVRENSGSGDNYYLFKTIAGQSKLKEWGIK